MNSPRTLVVVCRTRAVVTDAKVAVADTAVDVVPAAAEASAAFDADLLRRATAPLDRQLLDQVPERYARTAPPVLTTRRVHLTRAERDDPERDTHWRCPLCRAITVRDVRLAIVASHQFVRLLALNTYHAQCLALALAARMHAAGQRLDVTRLALTDAVLAAALDRDALVGVAVQWTAWQYLLRHIPNLREVRGPPPEAHRPPPASSSSSSSSEPLPSATSKPPAASASGVAGTASASWWMRVQNETDRLVAEFHATDGGAGSQAMPSQDAMRQMAMAVVHERDVTPHSTDERGDIPGVLRTRVMRALLEVFVRNDRDALCNTCVHTRGVGRHSVLLQSWRLAGGPHGTQPPLLIPITTGNAPLVDALLDLPPDAGLCVDGLDGHCRHPLLAFLQLWKVGNWNGHDDAAAPAAPPTGPLSARPDTASDELPAALSAAASAERSPQWRGRSLGASTTTATATPAKKLADLPPTPQIQWHRRLLRTLIARVRDINFEQPSWAARVGLDRGRNPGVGDRSGSGSGTGSGYGTHSMAYTPLSPQRLTPLTATFLHDEARYGAVAILTQRWHDVDVWAGAVRSARYGSDPNRTHCPVQLLWPPVTHEHRQSRADRLRTSLQLNPAARGTPAWGDPLFGGLFDRDLERLRAGVDGVLRRRFGAVAAAALLGIEIAGDEDDGDDEDDDPHRQRAQATQRLFEAVARTSGASEAALPPGVVRSTPLISRVLVPLVLAYAMPESLGAHPPCVDVADLVHYPASKSRTASEAGSTSSHYDRKSEFGDFVADDTVTARTGAAVADADAAAVATAIALSASEAAAAAAASSAAVAGSDADGAESGAARPPTPQSQPTPTTADVLADLVAAGEPDVLAALAASAVRGAAAAAADTSAAASGSSNAEH